MLISYTKLLEIVYDKQQYKAVVEASMVSTPEGFTYNRTISTSQYVTVKKPSARKPLHQFS